MFGVFRWCRELFMFFAVCMTVLAVPIGYEWLSWATALMFALLFWTGAALFAVLAMVSK